MSKPIIPVLPMSPTITVTDPYRVSRSGEIKAQRILNLQWKKHESQLTEARKIIEELLEEIDELETVSCRKTDYELYNQAKKFLMKE